eukprot:763133-Hanusia_phi.AAC.1
MQASVFKVISAILSRDSSPVYSPQSSLGLHECQHFCPLIPSLCHFSLPDLRHVKEKEDAFQLVEADGMNFKDIDVGFKCNKDIMLAAVRQNGLVLQFGRFSLPDGRRVDYTVDRGVVLQAVRQNRSAFIFADISLQIDRMIVLSIFDMPDADVMLLLRKGLSPLMLDDEVIRKAAERDSRAVESARRNLYICPNVNEETRSQQELRDLQAQALLTRHTENGDLCQGGTTPLMLAAMGGKSECVQVLSELGADVNSKNEVKADNADYSMR